MEKVHNSVVCRRQKSSTRWWKHHEKRFEWNQRTILDIWSQVEGRTISFILNINIREENKTETEIKGQLVEVIEDFQQDIVADVTSPAVRHISTVDKNCEQLSEEKRETFNYVTAKLIYITNRARPYLEEPVAHLCMRVSLINEYYCKKLEIFCFEIYKGKNQQHKDHRGI